MEGLLDRNEVVGLGEVGLDYKKTTNLRCVVVVVYHRKFVCSSVYSFVTGTFLIYSRKCIIP